MIWTPYTEGVFYNLPTDMYRGAEGINQSALKRLQNGSPAHLLAALNQPERKSPDKLFGTLTHHVLLEPDKPLPHFATRPEFANNSERNQWLAAQRNAGIEVLDRDDWDRVVGCVGGIRSKQSIRNLFWSGRSEVSCFVFLPDGNGRECLTKCRIDWVPDANCLCDVKTTADASEKAFQSDILEYGYHIQAAWYMDTWNILRPDDQRETYVIIAAEKKPPFEARPFNLSTQAIQLGRTKYRELLSIYIDCLMSGEYPGYPDEISTIDLPMRAYRN